MIDRKQPPPSSPETGPAQQMPQMAIDMDDVVLEMGRKDVEMMLLRKELKQKEGEIKKLRKSLEEMGKK